MISKNSKIFLAGHNGMIGSAIYRKADLQDAVVETVKALGPARQFGTRSSGKPLGGGHECPDEGDHCKHQANTRMGRKRQTGVSAVFTGFHEKEIEDEAKAQPMEPFDRAASGQHEERSFGANGLRRETDTERKWDRGQGHGMCPCRHFMGSALCAGGRRRWGRRHHGEELC